MITIMRGLYVLSMVAALTTMGCSSREQEGPGRLIARHELKLQVSDEDRAKVFRTLKAKLDSDKLVDQLIEDVPEIDYANEINISTRLIEYVIPSQNEVAEGIELISIVADVRTGIIKKAYMADYCF